MIHGPEKRRDIARSVLPSTRRRSARYYKNHAHRAVRARVRDMLATENWDDGDLSLDAQRYGSYRGVKEAVYERRMADKLGPIMRWAEAVADDLGDTPGERSKALRAMLPTGTAGWHAWTHIESLDAYDADPRRSYWQEGRERRAREWKALVSEIRSIVKAVLANGGRDALNIEVRRAISKSTGHEVWYTDIWNKPKMLIRECAFCENGIVLGDDADVYVDWIFKVAQVHHPEVLEAIRRCRPR